MLFPNATAIMQTIECAAAMSDDVLQAARAAMTKHVNYATSQWAPERWIHALPEKQAPLVPLLMALLDSCEAVAKAIDDNAWDDSAPISRSLAEELANQAYRLGAVVTNASSAHDTRNWNLPSMTGKELV